MEDDVHFANNNHLKKKHEYNLVYILLEIYFKSVAFKYAHSQSNVTTPLVGI